MYKNEVMMKRLVFRVCEVGVPFRGTLKANDEVPFQLWYRPSAEFQLSCLFWCTEDGGPPQKETTNANEEEGDAEEETEVIVPMVRLQYVEHILTPITFTFLFISKTMASITPY